MTPVPALQRLETRHAAAILAFELANREYFATTISDRGDDYFAHFAEDFDDLLGDQDAGRGAFFAVVDTDGAILGRFNLFGIDGDAAELGYRVAEAASGRGLATRAVQQICRKAADELGLRVLRARTTLTNVASQHVLTRAGFVTDGATSIAGQPGAWYRRVLSAPPAATAPACEDDRE